MRDVDRAISDITSIRSQIAAGALFRGFGPAVIAFTGVLAIFTATLQSLWPERFMAQPWVFLAWWIGIAVACVSLTAIEAWARSRRHHGGLADAMVLNAIEQFFPAGVAGAGITGVLMLFAPDLLWLLPGLWQILFAMALCAAVKTLPRLMLVVACWYLLCGLAVLMIASGDRVLSPWLMGVPFAGGQLMMALILKFSTEPSDDET